MTKNSCYNLLDDVKKEMNDKIIEKAIKIEVNDKFIKLNNRVDNIE